MKRSLTMRLMLLFSLLLAAFTVLTAVIYNALMVRQSITHHSQAMQRDAFAIAEARLGYSLNTTDEAALRQCAQKLVEQKPILQGHVMDQIYARMEREEAWIAPYYAGDYLYMVEENPALAFNFPEEGFNLFIDAMCIPAGAEHKEEAELSRKLAEIDCAIPVETAPGTYKRGEGDAAAMAMFGKSESELSEVERTMAGILASYSAEEIVAGMDVKQGDNLYLWNKVKVSDELLQQFPYLETVQIRRHLPDALVVTVTECTATVAVPSDGGYYYLSEQGKVLEQNAADGGLPLVTGVLCVLLGVYALLFPGASAVFVMRMVGVMMLISSAVNLINVLTWRE